MKSFKYSFILIGVLIALVSISCKKSSFLDKNPDLQKIIPSTVKDYEAILDNYLEINNSVPVLPELGADDYYYRPGTINGISPELRNIYVWNDDIWANSIVYNWNYPFNVIFTSNVTLEGIKKIKATGPELTQVNNLKGMALFLRGFYYYQLCQLFAPPYEVGDTKFGVPIRLTGDINEAIIRPTIEQNYVQILQDLKDAASLLAVSPKYKTRPSKAASLALLARTYLVMGNYDSASKYASECLMLKSELMDFNNSTVIAPFNVEVIWPGALIEPDFGSLPTSRSAKTTVDTGLINSYSTNDLRLIAFFPKQTSGGRYFRGSYSGSSFEQFGGVATDEIYLIKAECEARKGNLELALENLNKLMINRWKSSEWIPFSAATPQEALKLILNERRKELIFRGVRWSDIRRLNKVGENIAITRVLDDGSAVILTPNSNKHTYLIPPAVMTFHPEMPQNPR